MHMLLCCVFFSVFTLLQNNLYFIMELVEWGRPIKNVQ